jgi:hypothetical protein
MLAVITALSRCGNMSCRWATIESNSRKLYVYAARFLVLTDARLGHRPIRAECRLRACDIPRPYIPHFTPSSDFTHSRTRPVDPVSSIAFTHVTFVPLSKYLSPRRWYAGPVSFYLTRHVGSVVSRMGNDGSCHWLWAVHGTLCRLT